MSQSRSAIILLSGGIDSTTVLAIAGAEGYTTHGLTVRYGQRHAAELEAAKYFAAEHADNHTIIDVDLRAIGGSSLTSDLPVPKLRNVAQPSTEIPNTYVPARNTIFLSLALGLAEVMGSHDIFLGVNALDYSGYPDCRPEYIEAFQQMADLATRSGVEGGRITIHTPLIHMSKADIIRRGHELGVDFSRTISCYDSDGRGDACGACDSCQLRRRGFADAGIDDPTRYRS